MSIHPPRTTHQVSSANGPLRVRRDGDGHVLTLHLPVPPSIRRGVTDPVDEALQNYVAQSRREPLKPVTETRPHVLLEQVLRELRPIAVLVGLELESASIEEMPEVLRPWDSVDGLSNVTHYVEIELRHPGEAEEALRALGELLTLRGELLTTQAADWEDLANQVREQGRKHERAQDHGL